MADLPKVLLSRVTAGQVLLSTVMCLSFPVGAGAQGPVGPEFRVNTYTSNSQREPSVSVDNGFIVAWTSSDGRDGSQEGVFGQRYDGSGKPAGPEFRINTYTTGRQVGPSITTDGSGHFLVAWSSYESGIFNISAQRFDAMGGAQGSEFRVNTSPGGYGPSTATDISGNLVIAWETPGSSSDVLGQRYGATGIPEGPEFRVNTYPGGFQGRPAVARAATGDFVIVWMSAQQDGSGEGVFGQRFAPSGVPQGPEFRVNTQVADHQREPSVGVDADGSFAVTWTSWGQDGDKTGIFGQRFSRSGVPEGSEFQVNTYTTSYQNSPVIAVDADGNFVVVWRSSFQDGSGGGTFGQRYSSAGSPLGGEFQVNTYTTANQNFPSVGADSLGNFVVAWEAFGQDASDYGIFGQRYGPILPVELIQFNVD